MKKNYNLLQMLMIAILSLSLWSITLNAQITVTSFTPKSGQKGTTVTITGSNFSITPTNNTVFFGAVAGTVSAATATSLTVSVPSGANYQNASVTNTATQLTAYTDDPFIVTFPCGSQINSGSFDTKQDFTTGNAPAALAIGDLDGDGKADIVVTNTNSNTISVFKNTSVGKTISFAAKTDYATGSAPRSLYIGDLNGDGCPEVVVANSGSNTVSIFQNMRTIGVISLAAKVDYTTGSEPNSVSISDLDSDGKPDIAVTNANSNSVSVLKNTGAGGTISFAAKADFTTGLSPRGISTGDLNGDGKPDIAIANYSSNTLSVLKNTNISETISFAAKVDFTTGINPSSISIGDLDGNGKPDLAIANKGSNTVSVLRNTTTSGIVSFAAKEDSPTGDTPLSVSIGDVDGDGKPDLAAANNNSNTVSVFKNACTSGIISFAAKEDFATAINPSAVAIADLDGDAQPDLLVTNSSSASISALPNQVHSGPTMTSANTKNICSGTAVNLSFTSNATSTYTWVASNNPATTGESTISQTGNVLNNTIINSTASAQTVSYFVTPVSIAENCVGAPQTIQVIVNPLPNADAGADTLLNCDNIMLTLTGASTTSPVSYQWNAPGNNISNTQTITTDTSGIYKLTVTNNTTLCANIDSMLVSFDTTAPIITCPLAYQITNCVPGTVTINGTSDDITDSIKWFGSGIPTNNPAIISNQNNYLLWAKRNSNGCVHTDTVTVTIQQIFPTIHFPATMDTIPLIPILDTLTCAHDSVLLNFSGSTADSKIRIIRPNPMNDTVANNTYTTFPGVYKATIIDTITGCSGSALLFELKINVTSPQLLMPATLPPFNCSITSAILNGTSGTPNSILHWTGPTNFSSTNPATVNQSGDYVFSVTDPTNGCSKSDTLTLVQQNILLVNGSTDTTVCKGETVQLHVAPIGGTPNFTYNWNNNTGNTSLANVNPSDTTQYIVTVIDAAGCIGQDTVVVNIPAPITDSIVTFQPCDPAIANGEIQIIANNGVPPYQYSITNGQNYQASSIFNNLPFGNYPILITDALHCIHSDSAIISSISQKPHPDFIVNTNMMQADSFVVVDISNPRPDTVIWTFPSTVSVVNADPFAPVIVSTDTGAIDITMETHFGACIMYLTKTVQFIKADTIAASANGNGIESILIFPNPNTGQFSVKVKLYKKQTFALYVYNSQGIEQKRITVSESDYSVNNISLPNPIPGTYLLKVIAEYDSKSKTVVVTQ